MLFIKKDLSSSHVQDKIQGVNKKKKSLLEKNHQFYIFKKNKYQNDTILF